MATVMASEEEEMVLVELMEMVGTTMAMVMAMAAVMALAIITATIKQVARVVKERGVKTMMMVAVLDSK